MERLNFLAWLGAIGGLAGLGIGVMIWAYRGSGSRAVLFTEPIPLPQTPPGLNDARALDYFESGRQAFQEQNYQEALMEWTRAIQLAPNFAEAYHNRALVAVNLRRDGEAARDLARAGDLYLEQGNAEGVATIRQNFEAMKTRTTS